MMRIAVCYNRTPEYSSHGEARDRIADYGSYDQAKAVLEALQELGHQPELIPLAETLGDFLRKVESFAPAIVFNLCEGFWGNAHQEMNVAGIYELLRIPYSGSTPLCLGLTQDKFRAKALLLQQGLPTPPFRLATLEDELPDTAGMNYPLIVKPSLEDASQGIEAASVVDSPQQLRQRVHYVHNVYRQTALIEEFIEGRELNVAILGEDILTVLPPAEITFATDLARPIVCFDSKWSPQSAAFKGTTPVCPATLTTEELQLVTEVSQRAYRLFGCRDYARVDIRLRNKVPYILEINANPDISPAAGLARAAGVGGLAYPRLIEKILACASQRKESSHAQSATL